MNQFAIFKKRFSISFAERKKIVFFVLLAPLLGVLGGSITGVAVGLFFGVDLGTAVGVVSSLMVLIFVATVFFSEE